MEELDLELDGRVITVLFKNLSRHALDETVRLVKPAFIHNPAREIMVYGRVLAQAAAGTAHCYATVADVDRDRFWLFLEKVSGIELYQVPDVAIWQQVARWLAAFHHKVLGNEDLPVVRPYLIKYEEAYWRRWLDRAQTFADHSDTARLQLLARTDGRFGELIAGLNASPQAFLHGELYASNVLVDTASDTTRVCPVDWEMAGWGPTVMDIAALTAGNWAQDDRDAIAGAYYEASEWRRKISRDEFMRSLACAHAVVALQWLGWASKWEPPKEHRRDWVVEMSGWLDRI